MNVSVRNISMAVALGIASLLHATAQAASATSAGLEPAPSKQAPVSPPLDGIAPEASPDLPPKAVKRFKARKNFGVSFEDANRAEDQTDVDVTSETVNDVFIQKNDRLNEDERLLREMFPNQGGGFAYANDTGPGESATMVIRTSQNPKDEGIEEDLRVMHRILEKAIGRNAEGNARGHAMGIQLFALGQSRTPRSFYIEGFGPIFLLDTQLPLLPLAEKMDARKTKESDSTWEETKEELYGDDQSFRKSSKHRFGEDQSEPYDAAKVEELKDAILKALPNASNIHGFDDARLTVVVSSRNRDESKDHVRVITAPGTGVRLGDVVRNRSTKPRGANTLEKSEGKMSIVVKKSDIEEFAKKRIEFEEFKKRATTTVY